MATSYSKSAQTKPTIAAVHPFKIDIVKNGKNANGGPQYQLAVNYHSRLFTGMTLNENFLSYKKVTIENLDALEDVPSSFPGKNFYCVLKIKVENLKVKDDAEIIWVEDDKSVEELNPVKFDSSDNLRQTEARIIIGTLVNDREVIAGTTDKDDEVKTDYIIQYVYTNLMMCNMAIDGVPIIYPVPFGGGRLNF